MAFFGEFLESFRTFTGIFTHKYTISHYHFMWVIDFSGKISNLADKKLRSIIRTAGMSSMIHGTASQESRELMVSTQDGEQEAAGG
jgi:hypothetical protein